MQIDTAQLELLHGVVALLLPDSVLDHFEIVKLEEEDVPVPEDGSYTPYKRKVHLYLDERDERTAAYVLAPQRLHGVHAGDRLPCTQPPADASHAPPQVHQCG